MLLESSRIEELRDLVSPEKIKEQNFHAPIPKKVIIEQAPDHRGEQSVHVILVFPNNTDFNKLALPDVPKLFNWVGKTLRDALQDQAWLYVSATSEAGLRHR
jgi:hypothetical protein